MSLDAGQNFIGLVTATGNVGVSGNLTLSDPKGYIGLVTANNVAWTDPKTFIGLVTAVGSFTTTFSGNVTLDPGSKTGIVGNLTLSDPKGYIGLVTIGGISTITLADPKGFIGLVTVGGGTIGATFSGNITLDPGSKTQIVGNLTLSDPKTFIGLVTATLGSSPSVQAFGQFFPTLQSIASGGLGPMALDNFGRVQTTVTGNITLSDAKTFIGLVTIGGISTITLSDPKGYIGLVTIGGGTSKVTFLSNITLDPGSLTGIVGNVTLSDSKGFIGLVTSNTNLGAIGGSNINAQNDADGVAAISMLGTKASAFIYNGSFWDRVRSVGAAASEASIALGIPASGIMGYDGSLYQRITTGTDGRLQANVTVNNPISIAGNLTLSDSKGFIGLVTAVGNFTTSFSGNITLDAGSKTQIVGNLTLSDPKGFIGLVTAVGSFTTTFSGNVTLDPGSKTQIVGNVTLSDAKTFIGLVTAMVAGKDASGVTLTANPITVAGVDSNTIVRPLSTDTSGALTVNLGNIAIGTFGGSATIATGITSGLFFAESTSYDGTFWTRDVTANAANATTGYGTKAAGILGFDGTNYRRIITGTDGRIQGNVTVNNPISIAGNITLSDPKTYIGLVTVGGIGTITLSDPKGFIGLVTIGGGTLGTTFSGNITLDAGSKTGVVGNITLSDAKTYVGLVTATIGNTVNTAFSGNITLDPGSKTGIVGNVTLSDPKTYIGLVTATLGSSPSVQAFGQFFPALQSIASGGLGPIALDQFGRIQTTISGNVTLSDSKTFIGLVTIGGISTITLSDPKGFIGLTTAVNGQSWPDPKAFIGLVTIGGMSTITLSDPKGYIGLVTANNVAWIDPKTFIGLVTVGGISTITLADPKGFIGLVTIGGISQITLADSKGYIGLVTIGGIGTLTLSDPKGFIGLVTTVQTYFSLSTTVNQIISTTGFTTLLVPAASNRLYINNLHVASLGRSEIEIRSGSTTLIPFTALSTTGGYLDNFGDSGLPLRSINDALVVNLNGAATISIMANVRQSII